MGTRQFSCRQSFPGEKRTITDHHKAPRLRLLLIRSNTPTSFYRFALSCDGRARVDLISGTNATSPQPWIESASIPSGAPSHVKIGVLSKGEELSLWVNDQYQFTISDKTLHSGRIGFFARSGGDNAVTINFSNLKIYTLANQ